MRLFKKKEVKKIDYDENVLTPILRVSICTGEKTAGFIDKVSGKFHEYMLIENEDQLKDFMEACSIDTIEKMF